MFRIIKYHLYLLQLENYNLGRYWRVAPKKIFLRDKIRQKIVWTPKLSGVFTLAIILQIAVAYFAVRPLANDEVYLGFFPATFMFLFLFLSFFHFVFLTLAVLAVWPFDYMVKSYLVNKARTKMKQLTHDRGLVVIGITGSYGKTTMKEALAAILSIKFKIVKTPESVNTPVGISRLILSQLTVETEIFIVEMGAYQRGDIRALCEIAKPDIAVLTGINEAHLERFRSIENTIKGKFEIVENARVGGLVVLNGDDARVKENYQKFTDQRRVELYNAASSKYQDLTVPLLGDYIWGIINACGIIASELRLSEEEIRRGIINLKPIPHRLQLIENRSAGITVIDDSYNGNPDGAREAIKALAKFEGRRKIYITPGLVEMGERSREVHKEIGRELAGVADIVILIRNSVTPLIAVELDPHKVIYFDSATLAHNSLQNILKHGDVVMFQNDWPDNYL